MRISDDELKRKLTRIDSDIDELEYHHPAGVKDLLFDLKSARIKIRRLEKELARAVLLGRK